MTAQLAVTALRSAIARRHPRRHRRGPLDRGGQFRSERSVPLTTRPHRLDGPRRARGDNAAMESFFALLQKNVLDRQRWTTRDELRLAIVTWIERTYHRRRRQAPLGRLTCGCRIVVQGALIWGFVLG